jgi:hypothetical protein
LFTGRGRGGKKNARLRASGLYLEIIEQDSLIREIDTLQTFEMDI